MGIDQAAEPDAGDAGRRQGLCAVQVLAGRAHQGMVVGEGRPDRLSDAGPAAMEGQEADELAMPAQHRDAGVRPRLAHQAGEIGAQQRIGERGFGGAEGAPGLNVAFSQGPGMADLGLDHVDSAGG